MLKGTIITKKVVGTLKPRVHVYWPCDVILESSGISTDKFAFNSLKICFDDRGDNNEGLSKDFVE